MTTLDHASPRKGLFQRLVGGILAKGFWALSDQALVSIGNFVTTLALARQFTKAEYGNFATLWELLLWMNGLQAALIIYPLSVRGAKTDEEGLSRLASVSVVFTLAVSFVLAIAIAITGWKMDSLSVGLCVIPVIILFQLQETVRRAIMSHLKFRAALPGDAISYLGQAVLIWGMKEMGTLTVEHALLAIGVTSGLAAIVQALQVGVRKIPWSEIPRLAREYWSLGRWLLLSNLTILISSLGYFFVLRIAKDAQDVGVFAAIGAMMKLVNPLMFSFSGMIVPAVARAFHERGFMAARKLGLKYTMFGVMLVAPFFLFLLGWPRFALRIFYGDKYVADPNSIYLQILAAAIAIGFVGNMFIACLNGLERSRSNFHAQLINTIISIVFSLPAIAIWGLPFVFIGALVATFGFFLTAAIELWRAREIPVASIAGADPGDAVLAA